MSIENISLSRRNFLKIAGQVVAGGVIEACVPHGEGGSNRRDVPPELPVAKPTPEDVQISPVSAYGDVPKLPEADSQNWVERDFDRRDAEVKWSFGGDLPELLGVDSDRLSEKIAQKIKPSVGEKLGPRDVAFYSPEGKRIVAMPHTGSFDDENGEPYRPVFEFFRRRVEGFLYEPRSEEETAAIIAEINKKVQENEAEYFLVERYTTDAGEEKEITWRLIEAWRGEIEASNAIYKSDEELRKILSDAAVGNPDNKLYTLSCGALVKGEKGFVHPFGLFEKMGIDVKKDYIKKYGGRWLEKLEKDYPGQTERMKAIAQGNMSAKRIILVWERAY